MPPFRRLGRRLGLQNPTKTVEFERKDMDNAALDLMSIVEASVPVWCVLLALVLGL